MKKWLQWLLGIILVVLIVVALGAIVSIALNQWHGMNWMTSAREIQLHERLERLRAVPDQELPRIERSVKLNWRTPLTMLGVFRPLQILFGCMISLGLLILVVLGIILLIRYLRGPQKATGISAVIEPSVPAPVRTTAWVCPHCAHPVQQDWRHCPYCGGTLPVQTEGT